VLGWISVACWIIVYSPQILENYQLKSGEGLSVLFVVIWLLGDIASLAGAEMAGLLPTVIILALYYTVCDLTLLIQIYYYRYTNPTASLSSDERSPLLEQSQASRSEDRKDSLDGNTSVRAQVLQYLAGFTFVIGTGVVAWYFTRAGHSTDPDVPPPDSDILEWRSQVIGWISASLYLGARIPQIAKNMETKCEGLSLALFVYAIAGNLTFALSICVVSMESKHLIVNASWLAGSTLTVLSDLYVVYQFFRFRKERISERNALAIRGEAE